MALTERQRQRIEDLLAAMTLEEKIGQMNQESPSIVGAGNVGDNGAGRRKHGGL